MTKQNWYTKSFLQKYDYELLNPKWNEHSHHNNKGANAVRPKSEIPHSWTMIKPFAPGYDDLHVPWVTSGRLPAKTTAFFDNAHSTLQSGIEIEIFQKFCPTIISKNSCFVFCLFVLYFVFADRFNDGACRQAVIVMASLVVADHYCKTHCNSWWRHQMELFSTLLALCAGNSLVTGEFPSQRPVTRSFNVFFNLRLNKRESKQSLGWWFDAPSRSLWRHYNVPSHLKIGTGPLATHLNEIYSNFLHCNSRNAFFVCKMSSIFVQNPVY